MFNLSPSYVKGFTQAAPETQRLCQSHVSLFAQMNGSEDRVVAVSRRLFAAFYRDHQVAL